MKKYAWLSFLVFLAILSYLREIVFLSVNAIIAGNKSFYAKTTKIPFFLTKSPEVLIQYKYILTVGFTILFAVTTIIGLKLSFRNKLPYYFGIMVYSLCFFVAALVLSYSLLTTSLDNVYSFLRLIIEYLHNPIVFIILSASYMGYRYSQKTNLPKHY